MMEAEPPLPRIVLRASVLCILLLSGTPSGVGGHDGPPFPILRQAEAGSYLVSVWADPDVGMGDVWVILESVHGGPVPDGTRVEVGVAPVSGRLAEARYPTDREERRRGAVFHTPVLLDAEEVWEIRVLIDGPLGTARALATVRATPAGTIGPIGLLVYGLPFLAVGILLLRAVIRWNEPLTPEWRVDVPLQG